MTDFISILEKLSSIIAVLGVFILWLFSRNFVSKEEFKKELKVLEKELKAELKQYYQELKAENKLIASDTSKQKVNIAELNTKVDNLIKAVDSLSKPVSNIERCLLNLSKRK